VLDGLFQFSINLNGNAYQLDDAAYEALRAYLDRAEAVLKDNPDQAEIVADLEQAIAEKCNKVLGPHKTVVTAAEIEQVLKEMGPVESGTAEAGEVRGDQGAGTNDQAKSDTGAPKRLYQIREGAMISGVCNGLAAYLGIDVTIVRIIFVVLSVITKGAWIGVYFLAMFVIPYAHTSEQRGRGPWAAVQRAGSDRPGEEESWGFQGSKPRLETTLAPTAATVEAARAASKATGRAMVGWRS
jgi:phage shock protein PspC (stress-responsive transcriptional regulator)